MNVFMRQALMKRNDTASPVLATDSVALFYHKYIFFIK